MGIELYHYRDVHPSHRNALIIGNGLSIAYSPLFRYDSLFEAAAGLMEQVVISIFNQMGTQNFEFILSDIKKAINLNEAVGIECSQLNSIYEKIQQALIQVVQKVHPEKLDIDEGLDKFSRLSEIFRQFAAVFSTSYDLIPYWGIMSNSASFTDFFADHLTFSSNLKPEYKARIPLFFLHGALHLYTDGQEIKKVVAESKTITLPMTLEKLYKNKDVVPLFVSEGHSREKLMRILNNEYLTFCYENLKRAIDGVTVFGLSFENDEHISELIDESSIKRVAYGIYPLNKSAEDIIVEQAKVKRKLRHKEVVFFDSTTFGAGEGNLVQIPSEIFTRVDTKKWWM